MSDRLQCTAQFVTQWYYIVNTAFVMLQVLHAIMMAQRHFFDSDIATEMSNLFRLLLQQNLQRAYAINVDFNNGGSSYHSHVINEPKFCHRTGLLS